MTPELATALATLITATAAAVVSVLAALRSRDHADRSEAASGSKPVQ